MRLNPLPFIAGLGFFILASFPALALKGPPIEAVTSPSGIQAWLVRDETLPILTFELAWRGGSATDPEDRHGLTHLMASLLNEGAGALDAMAFQKKMADNAIHFGFNADRDGLTAKLRCLSQYKKACFELLKLAVTAPRFDADAIALMKNSHGASFRRQAQNPRSMAYRAFFASVFEGHPYAHDPLGDLASVEAITQSDLHTHFQRHVARDNMHISVVGDINARALAELLDEVFAGLPAQNSLPKIAKARIEAGPSSQHIARDGPQTTVVFGHAGIALTDPNFFPAYLVNLVLAGGGTATILGEEVREKRGLAYGVGTRFVPLRHADLWVGSVASDNTTAQQAMDIIQTELTKFTSLPSRLIYRLFGGPTLRDGKDYLTGSYALGFDSGAKIAGQMIYAQLHDRPMGYFETRNEKIEAVTLAQALEAARVLFSHDLRISSVGGTAIALPK
jgi:zinc protease